MRNDIKQVAECRACKHSYGDHTGLRCILFMCPAELPCARWERCPGADDVQDFIALQDGEGHVE